MRLDSGFHGIPKLRIPDSKGKQMLDSGFPYMGENGISANFPTARYT